MSHAITAHPATLWPAGNGRPVSYMNRKKHRREASLAGISIKRIYEPTARADGTRILVDRIWPRGISKDDAHLALWLKDIAPSTELRKWFGHDPERWAEFRRRYKSELAHNPTAVKLLKDHVRKGTVTLVYAARDSEHNNARVIAEVVGGTR